MRCSNSSGAVEKHLSSSRSRFTEWSKVVGFSLPELFRLHKTPTPLSLSFRTKDFSEHTHARTHTHTVGAAWQLSREGLQCRSFFKELFARRPFDARSPTAVEQQKCWASSFDKKICPPILCTILRASAQKETPRSQAERRDVSWPVRRGSGRRAAVRDRRFFSLRDYSNGHITARLRTRTLAFKWTGVPSKRSFQVVFLLARLRQKGKQIRVPRCRNEGQHGTKALI